MVGDHWGTEYQIKLIMYIEREARFMDKLINPKDYQTVPELARSLGITNRAIFGHEKRGNIKIERPWKGTAVVHKKEIERFIAWRDSVVQDK